jgi:hypothetical protein
MREVDDYVDFLIVKYDSVKYRSGASDGDEQLPEAGMETYLHDLERYETLLAQGVVQW